MQTLSKQKQHIIIGLSGGVDSAVSAYLLKQAGHHIDAIFMKNWEEEGPCPAQEDFKHAQAVCDHLKINLQLVNFANEYWQRVFSYFLDEYRAGRTPNPDILCNKEIKFNAFLNYAKQQGADLIATGHYVQKKESHEHCFLLKGSDPLKDQSYFLYALSEHQLNQSIFPIGHLAKTDVRKIARTIKLPNADKKDSTGICFIGERKFKTFLNDYLPAQPGPIQTLAGETLGQHHGLMFYTIGQRQGLNLGGQKGKLEAPWYVAGKDLKNNILIVVQGDHEALYQTTLIANQIHWINQQPVLPLRVSAKTRYRQADQECYLEALDHEQYRVTFYQAQRAITPGQSIVFYQDNICLGGGIIQK